MSKHKKKPSVAAEIKRIQKEIIQRQLAPKKPFKAPKIKKGVKSLTKAKLRKYNRLKKEISRMKGQVRAANKKFNYGEKKGKVNKARAKRTEAYKRLTIANAEMERFRTDNNIGKNKVHGKRIKKRQFNAKKATNTYSMGVWQFEERMNDYIKAKAIKKIVFKNTGKVINVRKTPASDIFTEYDMQRNSAYMELLAATVWVNVIEDDGNDILTIEFLN